LKYVETKFTVVEPRKLRALYDAISGRSKKKTAIRHKLIFQSDIIGVRDSMINLCLVARGQSGNKFSIRREAPVYRVVR